MIDEGGEGEDEHVTHVQVMQELHGELRQLGIETQLGIVPGASHKAHECLPALPAWVEMVVPRAA
jgi:hypothetical protein